MSPSPNKLLASLSSREYRRIAPRLHPITLSNGSLLPHCGRGRVYFPGSGVCSILSRMSDGTTIEVASIGSEGAVGLPALGSQLTDDTYVQVAHGTLQFMALHTFGELSSNSELGLAVDRFCAGFLQSVMQLVACNRLHPLEGRCARWILLTHERVRRARFELTQPFLAMAIGVKPQELSRAMGRLADDNILTHDGASVTILDSIALRRASCRCYKVLKALAEKPLMNRLVARRATPEQGSLDRNNVVPIRNLTVCTVCGLGNNCPHKTFDECLRALGSELRATSARAKWLLERRAQIVHQSLAKYERFLKRRHS